MRPRAYFASGARRALTLVLAVLFLSLPLAACTPEPRIYQMEYTGYMDTVSQLTMPAETAGAFRELSDHFEERLAYFDRLYTAFEEVPGVMNVWAVNRQAADGPVRVSEDLMDLLVYGQKMTARSGGAFSMTLGAVTTLWQRALADAHRQPDAAAVPEAAALDAALAHTDPDALILDPEAGTVYFEDPDMKLDLGAVAKGYVAERLAEELEARGVRSALINLGGNIRTVGWKDEGEETPWILAVQNPVRRLRESIAAYVGGELAPETSVTEPTAPVTEPATEATEPLTVPPPEASESGTETSTYATMPYLTLPTKPSPPPLDADAEASDLLTQPVTPAAGPRAVKGLTDPVHLTGEKDYLTVVRGEDRAVVTSGIYERYFLVDGYLYHHVLDPETGRPSQRYQSVTILGKDAGLADILSTALMNLSLEDGAALVREYAGTYAIWVDMEGYMYRSPGMAKLEMDGY